MAKRVFEIEKSETFMAGMSTSIDIKLDEKGKGTATIEWKRGEKKEYPVRKGQRLFVDMWGGFPDVQVWDPPKPPKDPIMRFLWDNGFPKKKVLDWDDTQFVDWEVDGDDDDDIQGFTWTMQEETVKFLAYRTEWTSSMSGNSYVGFKTIRAVAVKPGTTMGKIKEDFYRLMERYNDILVVRCPGY